MAFAFGEAVDLVLYGGAVAGTEAFDAALEHWGLVESFFQFLVDIAIGIGDPAAELFLRRFGCCE